MHRQDFVYTLFSIPLSQSGSSSRQQAEQSRHMIRIVSSSIFREVRPHIVSQAGSKPVKLQARRLLVRVNLYQISKQPRQVPAFTIPPFLPPCGSHHPPLYSFFSCPCKAGKSFVECSKMPRSLKTSSAKSLSSSVSVPPPIRSPCTERLLTLMMRFQLSK